MTPTPTGCPTVCSPPVLDLAGDERRAAMAADVRRAFTRHPKVLPPRWLYDAHGSELFERITRLDSYYPTEAERSILRARADEIADASGADVVVELGSGTSDKTRTILDAFVAADALRRFVPIDVSDATLRAATAMLGERYPGVEIAGVVGDFTHDLHRIPDGGKRLVAFLGGTLGNFYADERRQFLDALADLLRGGESLLIGFDVVKDPARIIAAYDDADGVTAAFIKNSLQVINRELGGDLDVDRFDYVPFWDPRATRVDMRLRARESHRALIADLGLDVEFAAGEELRVEISTKFAPTDLECELVAAGFRVDRQWIDAAGDFALVLATRT